MRTPAAIAFALFVSSTAFADTRFVDDDAQVGGDGLSWATAYRYLRDALSDAVATEIRVAQGTYLTDRSENFPNGMGVRTASINLVTGVAIRGGYAGQGAVDPDERDVGLYETIISGDIGVPFDDSDNSYHVIIGDGEDGSAVLEGFTITGGNADVGQDNADGGGMSNFLGSPTVIACTFAGNVATSRGGGMSNRFSSPTVSGCTFRDNTALVGAGMYNYKGGPVVTECLFEDNTATSQGGGMDNSVDSTTIVTACAFTGNTAENGGGGMHISLCTSVVIDCTFDGNTTESNGGAIGHGGLSEVTIAGCSFTNNIATLGGGAVRITSNDDVDLANCTFEGNAASDGGAVHNAGPTTMIGCSLTANVADASGGALFTRTMAITLDDVAMVGNSARTGGGMFQESGSSLLGNVTIAGNSAAIGGGVYVFGSMRASRTVLSGNDAVFGGGLYSDGGSPTLDRCRVTDNTAALHGAGIYSALGDTQLTNCLLTGNEAGFEGGGMYNLATNPTLINCSFTDNGGGSGSQAMFNTGGAVPLVTNCIIWSDDSIAGIDGDATITYSDVQGGWTGEGNINLNPLYADPANGDYTLLPGSPCIDAGDNDAVPATAGADLEGNPRFANDLDTADTGLGTCPVTDMGGYEFPTQCPWDLDCDGVIGINDFLDLLAQWGANPGGPPDFDGDGTVGINDFLTLLANWGDC